MHKEFEAISERGGVPGAMDTLDPSPLAGEGQERGESIPRSLTPPISVLQRVRSRHKNHDGILPLIGVNTFLPKEHAGDIVTTIELIRSTEEEKNQQIANVEAFKANRNAFLTSPRQL